MDNLSAHHVTGVKDIIRSAGARRFYLPAYSPDFNPIEQVFSKLKSLIRKAGKRTREALWKCIGKTLEQFSPQECSNYLRNSGYD